MRHDLNEKDSYSYKIKELEDKLNNKVELVYDTMIKGDAQLYAELKILEELVFKIKGDLKRYLFISAAWIGWWLIHLVNKILLIYT